MGSQGGPLGWLRSCPQLYSNSIEGHIVASVNLRANSTSSPPYKNELNNGVPFLSSRTFTYRKSVAPGRFLLIHTYIVEFPSDGWVCLQRDLCRYLLWQLFRNEATLYK